VRVGPASAVGSLLVGALAAIGIGVLGRLLFAESPDNWYVSIGEGMLRDSRLRELSAGHLFLVLAVPAALFSPVGEELFFRGMIHECFVTRVSTRAAMGLTGSFFGLVHLFHHGISAGTDGVDVHALSGLIWVLLVAGLSVLFTVCRLRTGSIWSAVLCHVAFNVTMIASIVRSATT
jgi:hypothetical protein